MSDNNLNDYESVDIPKPAAPKKRKKNKISNIIVIVVVAVAAIAFGIAIFMIVSENLGRSESKEKYAEAESNYVQTISPEELGSREINTMSENTSYTRLIEPTRVIDWKSLQEKGPNVVAWVEVPTCNISYPVVQGADNDFYLKKGYDDTDSYSGAIFMDYRMEKDWSNYHMIIYGHHMTDGSMFANLLSYDNQTFFNQNEGKNFFFIYTPECIRVYQIFSVEDLNIEEHKTAFRIEINSKFTIEDYADYVMSKELYDTGIEFNGGQIVTLFTCQNDSSSNVRHMLQGQLVEKISY